MAIQLFLLLCFIGASLQYDACTDPSYTYQGYTFTIDYLTNQKVWSHCEFPNPKFDHSRCGMTVTTGYHFLCDPEYMVTAQGKLILSF